MKPDADFDEFYRSVLPRFFKKELSEIQEETDLLLTFKNYYTMKKVMLRSGIFSAIIFIIGAFCKIMHWPVAAVMLFFSILVVSLVFLPLFFLLKSKEQKPKTEKVIIGTGVLFGMLFCISTLFKIMYLPYASMLWLVALGVLFFIFLPLFFFSGIRNPETKLNTILSSVMILIAGGLLFFTLTDLRSGTHNWDTLKIMDKHLREVGVLALEMNSSIMESDSVQTQTEIRLESKKVIDVILKIKLDLLKGFSNQINPIEDDIAYHLFEHNDFTTHFFFNEENDNPQPLTLELKSTLNKFIAFVGKKHKVNTSILSTEDVYKGNDKKLGKVSWEKAYFYRVPIQFALRNLNQILVDVKIIEASCST